MEEYSPTFSDKRKQHPIERANFLSRIFFCYLIPFFKKGLTKEIDEDDMYATSKSHDATKLGDRLQKAWIEQMNTKTQPSLFKALLIVFRWELFISAMFFLLSEVLKIAQPFLIAKLLTYYEPNHPELRREDAYIYAGLIIAAVFGAVITMHNYQLHVMTLGMKIRMATCSLIYRKALKLSKSALAETTIGQMVNLLSNDVGRFDLTMQYVHNLWLAPIATVIIMGFLYVYVGPSGLAGVTFLLLFIPVQVYMGKKTSIYRLRTALRTDERVRLMNEIITGIQVIKMYTWEKPFAKLVEFARKKEIQQIQATSVIRAIMISCNIFLNKFAVYLCVLVYVLTGNTMNAAFAFTMISFHNVLKNVVTMHFLKATTQFAETLVSIRRIQQFLLHQEVDFTDTKIIDNGLSISRGMDEDRKNRILLSDVSVAWRAGVTDNVLEGINFTVGSTQLVAVVGSVGCGKSTLFHTILRELPPQNGNVEVLGKVSYASQEPWLFGGSVRQNIVFGQHFSPEKYDEVIRVCALDRDLSLLPHGDRTLVGERGVTLSGGQKARLSLARAIYNDADIYLLDDPLSAVDAQVGRHIFDYCINGYLKNKCVALATHQLQYLKNVDNIYLLENGKIATAGTYEELRNSDSNFTKLLLQCDDDESQAQEIVSDETIAKDTRPNGPAKEIVKQGKESRAKGKISSHVYSSYFGASGNWCTTIIFIFAFLLCQILGSLTDYFITLWVNVEQWRIENINNETVSANDTMESPEFTWIYNTLFGYTSLYTYSSLVLALIIVTNLRSLGFFKYTIYISRNMHNKMFSKVVHSTMRFFHSNPSGRILNRFSKDLGSLDETLPVTLIDTIQTGLAVASISVLIGSLYPWVFVPTLLILVIFYFLRNVYLASSRNLKRVEAVTRSPIFTYLSATLQGLTTIRAFRIEDMLRLEFERYQNVNSAAYFMFVSANRSFAFWLDFHCVLYVALIVISILFIEDEFLGGNVGLALTQSMTMTGMFQAGMRQWSELENHMTAVERIQEYADLDPEMDDATKEPPKGWPNEGKIAYEHVSLRYSPEDPIVLNDVDFKVEPKQKIGVVGRTGAGKSSIIQALFRLAPTDGCIFIDGVDTKRVSLNTLRSAISIIPQEPVLFSGTLRKNLDPFDEYSDEVLWNALSEVELKGAVEELPLGLSNKMSEGGLNFSVGQRQLLCLARAIVRKNKILVLDEATANVDPYTDTLIQDTIRRKFADCTVLTVAHRLHTIIDSDKVIVMDAGEVVQFDHPYLLLKDTEGAFYKLVMQTGGAMSENLISLAEAKYNHDL